MKYAITDDEYDALADELKEIYSDNPKGGYVIKIEGMPEPPAAAPAAPAPRSDSNDGLKRALKSERDNTEQWRRLGKTPKEIEEILEREAKREEEELKRKGQYEQLRQKDEKKWEEERKKLNAQLAASERAEKHSIVSTKVIEAFSKAGFTETGMKLLPDRYYNRVEVSGEPGAREVAIKDKEGNIMINKTGGTASFEDLAREAIETYPDLVLSTAKAGAGAPSGNASLSLVGKKMLMSQFKQLAPEQQMELATKGDVQFVDAM